MFFTLSFQGHHWRPFFVFVFFCSWIFFLCPLPTAFQSENAPDLDNAIKRVHTGADTLDTVVKEQVIEDRKKKMKEGSWDHGSERDWNTGSLQG